MTTTEKEKYTVQVVLPNRVVETLENEKEISITAQGEMSHGMFLKLTGGKRDIMDHICLETHDRNNYTIRVFLANVLACENLTESHQGMLINAMREREKLPPLNEKEMERRARHYENISMETAQFLLECAIYGVKPGEMNLQWEMERAKKENITLDDLLSPEDGEEK